MERIGPVVEFKTVPVGTLFGSNGNEWIKNSTRTAILVEEQKIYYFRQKDMVYGVKN